MFPSEGRIYVSSLLWDRVDTDLYSRCFTGQAHLIYTLCTRSGHTVSSCIFCQKEKSLTPWPQLVAYIIEGTARTSPAKSVIPVTLAEGIILHPAANDSRD